MRHVAELPVELRGIHEEMKRLLDENADEQRRRYQNLRQQNRDYVRSAIESMFVRCVLAICAWRVASAIGGLGSFVLVGIIGRYIGGTIAETINGIKDSFDRWKLEADRVSKETLANTDAIGAEAQTKLDAWFEARRETLASRIWSDVLNQVVRAPKQDERPN